MSKREISIAQQVFNDIGKEKKVEQCCAQKSISDYVGDIYRNMRKASQREREVGIAR